MVFLFQDAVEGEGEGELLEGNAKEGVDGERGGEDGVDDAGEGLGENEEPWDVLWYVSLPVGRGDLPLEGKGQWESFAGVDGKYWGK